MKFRKNSSVKRTVQTLFIGIMIISLTLMGIYSVILVQELMDHAEKEAQTAISTYVKDFKTQQLVVENYLANLALSNTYFKQMAAASTESEMYLYSHALQDSLDTLLAVSGKGYSVVLYHSTCDLMVSVQHDISPNDELHLLYERELKQTLHTYLTGNSINTSDWFCLSTKDEVLYCRVVQYKNVYCCCAYALSDLIEGFSSEEGDTIILLHGEDSLFDSQLPISLKHLDLPKAETSSTYASNYLVSQATLGNLTLLRFSPYALGVGTPIIWIVLSLVLLVVLFAAGTFYLWRSVYQPMKHLTTAMRNINEGKSESTALNQVYTSEEFRQVNATVKSLLSQITMLKIDGYEKEIAQRDAQLQYLRAQIRPHFYLNCLKNLYAMAQVSTPQKMQESIILLSKHMRYILSDHDHFAPLQNELGLCENYLTLFSSMNTSYSPELRIEIDDQLKNIPIPPVSVLTLVENSLKYSLTTDHPLRILITANVFLLDGQCPLVNLTVRDNGPGLSEDRLYQLNHLDISKTNDPHVGIRNLIRRFTVLYGDEFQIGFFNGTPQDQYCGAQIELFFPLREGGEHIESTDR